MKRILFLFAGLALASCSTVNQQLTKPPSTQDHWVSVSDAQGKVTAEINMTTGDVQYFADPKDAFRALFGAFAMYQQTCKPVPQAEAPKKKEAKPVKKEEPKK